MMVRTRTSKHGFNLEIVNCTLLAYSIKCRRCNKRAWATLQLLGHGQKLELTPRMMHCHLWLKVRNYQKSKTKTNNLPSKGYENPTTSYEKQATKFFPCNYSRSELIYGNTPPNICFSPSFFRSLSLNFNRFSCY